METQYTKLPGCDDGLGVSHDVRVNCKIEQCGDQNANMQTNIFFQTLVSVSPTLITFGVSQTFSKVRAPSDSSGFDHVLNHVYMYMFLPLCVKWERK